jgi:hypothetical protein
MAEISEPYSTRFQVEEEEVSVVLEHFEPRDVLTHEGPARAESVVWRRASGV